MAVGALRSALFSTSLFDFSLCNKKIKNSNNKELKGGLNL
jgi:hypothetical protein